MKYKIFIITIPLIGHMTPLVASLKELTSANVQVIVYSTKKFQIPIEQCDAEFRELKNVDREPIKINDSCKDKVHLKLLVAFMLEKQMHIFEKTVVQVVRDILTDCPDLILYDDFAFYAKLTVRFLRENRSNLIFLSKLVDMNLTEVIEMPKFAAYTTTIPVTLPTFFSMPIK
jgi:UDP:flavonoid glycosyltransferase YjiC (YdhE family)